MLSHSEINELEKKLSKYRLKRTLLYSGSILIGLSAVATLSLLFFLYRSDVPTLQEVHQVPHETIQEKESNGSSVSSSPVLTVENNMTKVENTIPDMPQEKSKEEILRLRLPDTLNKTSASEKRAYTPPPEDFDTPPVKKKAENELDLPVLKRNGSSEEPTFYRNKEEQIDTTLLPPPPPLEESKPKGVIKIESQEINSISYLKEKFDTTHNIVFALMLAEEYYLSKNYVESNKWALIANNLDAENEKSWIWFAKSKVKLGQKEDAILALKTYLKNTKSQAAQSLLNQITLGEPIQ